MIRNIKTNLESLHRYHENRPTGRGLGHTFYKCHEVLACISMGHETIIILVDYRQQWNRDALYIFLGLMHEYDMSIDDIQLMTSSRTSFVINNTRVLVYNINQMHTKSKGIHEYTEVNFIN